MPNADKLLLAGYRQKRRDTGDQARLLAHRQPRTRRAC